MGICVDVEAVGEDIWELGEKRFLGFEATSGSPLVREMLAQPIERGFERAETARVVLSIARRSEEARLLRDYMEYAVVADLLGLERRNATTVGEAISQQRAAPTPVNPQLRARAMEAAVKQGARVNAYGRVFLIERNVIFTDPETTAGFGFPASRNDSPRDRAHRVLFSSSCLDRGSCWYLGYFFQLQSTRRVLAISLNLAPVLIGLAALVWFGMRAKTRKELEVKRPLLLLGLLLAPPMPLLLWFSAVMLDFIHVHSGGTGLGIFIITFYLIPVTYVIGLLLLILVFALLRRLRILSFWSFIATTTLVAAAIPHLCLVLAGGRPLSSIFGWPVVSQYGVMTGALYGFSVAIVFWAAAGVKVDWKKEPDFA
jgi:hypothetical protein